MEVGGLKEEAMVEIMKPRSDKRDYRRIVLDNSLQVLLISDPETDKVLYFIIIILLYVCLFLKSNQFFLAMLIKKNIILELSVRLVWMLELVLSVIQRASKGLLIFLVRGFLPSQISSLVQIFLNGGSVKRVQVNLEIVSISVQMWL